VSSGIAAGMFKRGGRYRVTGVVGQHASASGRLDGYRVWLRDLDDVELIAEPTPSPTATPKPTVTPRPSATPKPTATPKPNPTAKPTVTPKPTATPRPTATPKPSPTAPPTISIADAILTTGQVAVEGVVIAGSGLLDASGQTVVIQDASGAIAMRKPSKVAKIAVGRRLSVIGTSGRSNGAPRILGKTITDLGPTDLPDPLVLDGQPSAATEWRLVKVAGTIKTVHRSGATWKAELAVGSELLLVSGINGAKIPVDRITVGATVTVVGIVKRPAANARDRRYAIVPRDTSDVIVTAQSGTGTAADTSGRSSAGSGTSTTRGAGSGAASGSGSGVAGRPGASAAVPAHTAAAGDPAAGQILDVDLVDLPASASVRVRVGGLISAVTASTFLIDDGTGTATVEATGDALAVLPQLQSGMAVNIVGTALADPDLRLTVSDPADIIPVADLGTAATPDPAATSVGASDATLGDSTTSLADPEDASATAPGGSPTGVLVVVGLMLALTIVGLVAVALGRRPAGRFMAHPVPGLHRTP
jgi:hypothetical protein